MPAWVTLVQIAIAAIIMGPALVHLGVALPGQPGMADLPGTVNFHWLVQTQGLGEATESGLLMHPATLNRVVLDGIPFDAFASWPFTAVFGWPAGFTVFVWLSIAALGISTAWLANGWWKSPTAAVVAGAVAQTHPFLIRELSFGRPTQVFGAIFLPLALALTLKRLSSTKRSTGVLAGIAWGMGALSYWFYGAYFAIGLAVILTLSSINGREKVAIGLESLAGLALVTAWPLVTVLSATESIPGQGLNLTSMVTHGDHELSLRQLIEFRDLGESIVAERVLAVQIATIALAGWAIKATKPRQWAIPLMWLIIALLFAAGPSIQLPGGLAIPGPFLVFDATDLTRRNWWPDRALILAVPATALLVGGGVMALIERVKPNRPLVFTMTACILLVGEAFLMIPGLPLATTWGAESPKTQQLAKGVGPVLILPMGTNGDQPDARMMIDQIHHGRPLVNGPMPYTSSTAPPEYLTNVQSPALAALVACEAGNTPSPSEASDTWPSLQAWGVNSVFLDSSLATRMRTNSDRYTQCIAEILGPSTGGDPLMEFTP